MCWVFLVWPNMVVMRCCHQISIRLPRAARARRFGSWSQLQCPKMATCHVLTRSWNTIIGCGNWWHHERTLNLGKEWISMDFLHVQRQAVDGNFFIIPRKRNVFLFFLHLRCPAISYDHVCDMKCGRGDYHALRDAISEAEGRHPEEVAEVADAALQTVGIKKKIWLQLK